MADLFIKSYENSQLNNIFKSSGYTDISYTKKSGAPPRVVKLMVTPSVNAITPPIANSTISFRVPRVGHLLGALIQWTFASGVAIPITSAIGNTIAVSIVFNSGAYPLYRQSAASALVSRQTSFVSKSMNLNHMALPLDPNTFYPTATSNTGAVSFCNIGASFFESEENLYDCQNNVQATIDCLLGTTAQMAITNTAVFSSLSGRLFTFHALYDTETENLLLATNRPKGTVQAQLGIDSSFRSVTIAAGATAKITINSNACLRQLAFRVRENVDANRRPALTKDYTHYTLSVNGENLHYQVPRIVGNFLGNHKGFSAGATSNGAVGGALTYEGQGWTVLPFGYDVMDRTESTGLMAFKNLNQVEVAVESTGVAFLATDTLEYCTEEWVFYEFDIYSGEVSISVSS